MKVQLNAQTLKMVGGGIIIAGAFAIMFPGLETYVGSLLRLGTFIIFALLVAFAVSLILTKVRGVAKPKSEKEPHVQSDTTSDT